MTMRAIHEGNLGHSGGDDDRSADGAADDGDGDECNHWDEQDAGDGDADDSGDDDGDDGDDADDGYGGHDGDDDDQEEEEEEGYYAESYDDCNVLFQDFNEASSKIVLSGVPLYKGVPICLPISCVCKSTNIFVKLSSKF